MLTEELFTILADTLTEATGNTLGETLGDVEDEALVKTLLTLLHERNGSTQRNTKPNALRSTNNTCWLLR